MSKYGRKIALIFGVVFFILASITGLVAILVEPTHWGATAVLFAGAVFICAMIAKIVTTI